MQSDKPLCEKPKKQALTSNLAQTCPVGSDRAASDFLTGAPLPMSLFVSFPVLQSPFVRERGGLNGALGQKHRGKMCVLVHT
jgi:hypothetical protein